ncbi:hypothetical protein OBBRIDRAFT_461214 [Obba rivulosa]|uniref:Uncharacterized protein n=1 Tax=Obba rivulosa TaxID=1052685 RepID=A0A8E2DM57_9APHY|nr:hypothetical protein OBBRIDRAFT_461214 [Obba rivulosa]
MSLRKQPSILNVQHDRIVLTSCQTGMKSKLRIVPLGGGMISHAHKWLKECHHKSLPLIKRHWQLLTLFFLSAVISCIGWSLQIRPNVPVSTLSKIRQNQTLYLTTRLIDIIPTKGMMTLEWTIVDYQVSIDNQNNLMPYENQDSCPDITIHFVADLLVSTGSQITAPDTQPDTFLILNGKDWTTSHGNKLDRRSNNTIFRTDLLLCGAGR